MKRVIRNGRLVALPTLPVTNCDSCGACCRHMGTPPGFAAFYPIGPVPEDWNRDNPDRPIWESIPPSVESELRSYYDAVKRGDLIDRTDDFASNSETEQAVKDGRLVMSLERARQEVGAGSGRRLSIPCLWYDEATGRCKHYEYRPTTCRDPEVMTPGNEDCLRTRERFRIPLPVRKS